MLISIHDHEPICTTGKFLTNHRPSATPRRFVGVYRLTTDDGLRNRVWGEGGHVLSTFFTFNITHMGVAWQEASADLRSPTPPNVLSVAESCANEKQSLFVAMVTMLRDLIGGGYGLRASLS